jgi:hypothetical protein
MLYIKIKCTTFFLTMMINYDLFWSLSTFETILTSHVKRFQYKHVEIFLNDWTRGPLLVKYIRVHTKFESIW